MIKVPPLAALDGAAEGEVEEEEETAEVELAAADDPEGEAVDEGFAVLPDDDADEADEDPEEGVAVVMDRVVTFC